MRRLILGRGLRVAFGVLLLTTVGSAWAEQNNVPSTLGMGEKCIHVIPTLSSPSVKNGGKLTINAVIKAQAGVARVSADIGGVETVLMKLAQGASAGTETLGLWSVEWTAHDLEEKMYDIVIAVTDREGHRFEDRSLKFSDPAAGISSIGSMTYPNGGMRIVGSIQGLIPEETSVQSVVVDTVNGYAYFGCFSSIVKVSLGSGNSAPTRIGAVTLQGQESDPTCAVIDVANGYAYFGTNTSPGIVVKIALGAGNDPPMRVSALTFNAGEDYLRSAVIDTSTGYGYFSTFTTPGKIVKVILGTNATAPTRESALTLNANEDRIQCGVGDIANGFAYFGTFTNPGIVIKVALGAPNVAPTRIGAVTLNSGEVASCAVIDPSGSFAYIGTFSDPGIVVKVAIGSGNNAPSRVSSTTLNSGEQLNSATIDSTGAYAYFGTFINGTNGTNSIVKMSLASDPPLRVGALTFDTSVHGVKCAGIVMLLP